MSWKFIVLGAGLIVSACTVSPYESCIQQVRFAYNGQIASAQKEVKAAQANLSRGYRIKKHSFTETYVDRCVKNGVLYACTKERKKTTEVPIPINRDAEAQRLRRNSDLLKQLIETRARAAAQCNGLPTSS